MNSEVSNVGAIRRLLENVNLNTIFILSIFFLFLVIIALYYIQIKKTIFKEEQKIKNGKKKHLLGDSFIAASLQVLVVTMGAVLAIQFTSIYETKKEENSVLTRLKYSSVDLVSQDDRIQQIIGKYHDGALTIDDLQNNLGIDMSLVEDTLYRDDVIRILPTVSYSLLLSIYRQINIRIHVLDSTINNSPDAMLFIYEEISKNILYFKKVTDLVVQYRLDHQISENDFLSDMEKIILEISDSSDSIIMNGQIP